jgi:outer membrane lipoprotein-sorting protein
VNRRFWPSLLFAAMLQTPHHQVSGQAPATQPAIDQHLQRQLEEIDRRAAQITDLTSDFVQLKHTALLKKPLESRGRLRIRGVAMRWDTTDPSPGVMVIDEQELRLYSPAQSLLEIYPMQRGLGQIAASPLPRLAVVREHFDIAGCDWPGLDERSRATHVAVKLTPREESLARHVQEVRVLLEVTTGCASAVRMLDPDGDELEISFLRIRTNTGVREDEVRFDPPSGTTISRPLEAAPPTSRGAEGVR